MNRWAVVVVATLLVAAALLMAIPLYIFQTQIASAIRYASVKIVLEKPSAPNIVSCTASVIRLPLKPYGVPQKKVFSGKIASSVTVVDRIPVSYINQTVVREGKKVRITISLDYLVRYWCVLRNGSYATYVSTFVANFSKSPSPTIVVHPTHLRLTESRS